MCAIPSAAIPARIRAALAPESVANIGAPYRVNPFQGREATTPSVIRKIREVQRREEAPPNGGTITPKDVHMVLHTVNCT